MKILRIFSLFTQFSVTMAGIAIFFQKIQYRHSSIYAVNVETQKENRGSKNRVNQGYLLVRTKGEENRIEL